MNKIVLASVAMAMVSGAANAALISNGGKPQYSITEIQAKVDSGQFKYYPFVAGKGIQSNEHLFSKTFEDGKVLPRVTDFVALQKAIKKSNTILVADASKGIILPCPEIFIELAKQNGVSCYNFMEHYVESTTDIDSDAFGEHARAQSEILINMLEVKAGMGINMQALIDAGLKREMALSLRINQLNDQITELNGDVSRLQQMLNDAQIEAGKAYQRGHDAGVIAGREGYISLADASASNLHYFDAGFRAGLSLGQQIGERLVTFVEAPAEVRTTGSSWIGYATVRLSNGLSHTVRFDASNVRIEGTAYAQSIVDNTYAYHDAANDRVVVIVDNGDDELRRFSVDVPGQTLTRSGGIDTVADLAGRIVTETHRYRHDTLDGTHYRDWEILANTGSWYNPDQNRGSAVAGAISSVIRAGDPTATGLDIILGTHEMLSQITAEVRDLVEASYTNGYNDGYADGYRDGFVAGAESVR